MNAFNPAWRAAAALDRALTGPRAFALADPWESDDPRSDFFAPRDGFAASGADTTTEANGRPTR